ncbi:MULTISPECIES: NADH-quinone oxidoreductase subunit NuoG [unclassified Novosphingobium]|uniref:NADH-quinone oxidoreductase subunit NuoG n=1 Tax=unclassified Novosphingobium TaxID=2644732 RepID=UPI00086DFCF2|nr:MULTISPECIES: NADH-quinone oxidoreductase subunit NuoG [unclassified Novosphingobium]MBN9145790.1 NADH-quinone oxidoreductase subunit G [Novosphingobium sp.]MDR6706534.1 NADH-quinone oxidoreductase subunit G [Novosphingobium sp. 1748]ODU82324.1 MAG: NADH-quinone oxidoreductase subunit G [Novosphingobium sp. SCN 63-17]OJX97177.1 MAG: NADH-quinone oxidoreductase subunit G [Novosphingobium sp. 63-713]
MPKVKVDGVELEVPAGATVLQACEMAGKEIPRFCYHERLSIAGNCRMCLVEVKPGPPKPQASCALPASEGQEIRTDSEMVKKAREGVMEFLLINHPLDCPICDQGGECDLQDQSVAYGRGSSRYHEHKRAVTEKYMGPLIKTVMTRCIQCTRCVRFSEEIAGVDEIGALYRGENMQISTYLEKASTHELSANVIDLCPVGALTSRPYAFEARPWELKKTISIDVSDAIGSNIRVDARGREAMRILPRVNDDVNEEWLSDKGRYMVDGLSKRRLDRPFIRLDGKLKAVSWDEALAAVARIAPGNSIAAVAGDLVDVETMYAAKKLLSGLGSSVLEGRQTGLAYSTANLAAVNFNSGLAGIESADAILIVGSHVRWEAAVLNARLRKAVKHGAKVFIIGPEWETTYPAEFLGSDASVLNALPAHVWSALQGAKRPALIIGGAGLAKGALEAGLAISQQLGLVRTLEDGSVWNGFNVLHMAASRMGGLLLGYAQKGGINDVAAAKPKLLLSLGADEVDYTKFADSMIVYVGHHGDKGAHAADVILPASAFTEKAGIYVNTEGRVQFAEKAVFAPGDAREDWAILRAIAQVLNVNVGFDSFDELRSALFAEYPALLVDGGLIDFGPLPTGVSGSAAGEIAYPIKDFYLTNPIARASETLARCSAELLHGSQPQAEAAE